MNERYYFWTYSKSYGWRQVGCIEGYSSLKELKKDNAFYISREEYKILKAEVIEHGNKPKVGNNETTGQ